MTQLLADRQMIDLIRLVHDAQSTGLILSAKKKHDKNNKEKMRRTDNKRTSQRSNESTRKCGGDLFLC